MDNTKQIYDNLYKAFKFFNRELFGNKLPMVMLTLTPKRNALGYFHAESWKDVNNKEERQHHISMNPHYFANRPLDETLSTLVHEMVHLQQQIFGKPGKGAYHNKEWAQMMKDIGLMPSRTGMPGGKETGPTCSHYILEGDKFSKACEKLLKTKFTLDLAAIQFKTKTKKRNKTVYVCEESDVKIWGKPGLFIICGDTGAPFKEIKEGDED